MLGNRVGLPIGRLAAISPKLCMDSAKSPAPEVVGTTPEVPVRFRRLFVSVFDAEDCDSTCDIIGDCVNFYGVF